MHEETFCWKEQENEDRSENEGEKWRERGGIDCRCWRDDKRLLSRWHAGHFSWMLTAQFPLVRYPPTPTHTQGNTHTHAHTRYLSYCVWHAPRHQSNPTWRGCRLALSFRSPHHNTTSLTKGQPMLGKIWLPGSTAPESLSPVEANEWPDEECIHLRGAWLLRGPLPPRLFTEWKVWVENVVDLVSFSRPGLETISQGSWSCLGLVGELWNFDLHWTRQCQLGLGD